MLIFCGFCPLIIRANMPMYDFLQKNIKNNSENIGVNNTVCTRSQTCCFCPNFRHNLGDFYESYICAFVCQCIKNAKDIRTSRVVVVLMNCFLYYVLCIDIYKKIICFVNLYFVHIQKLHCFFCSPYLTNLHNLYNLDMFHICILVELHDPCVASYDKF